MRQHTFVLGGNLKAKSVGPHARLCVSEREEWGDQEESRMYLLMSLLTPARCHTSGVILFC